MHTVYKHTSPSGKVYIGITSQVVTTRWRNGVGYKNQPRFWNAIQKYGWDNFQHEVLFENLTEEEAVRLEIELIAKYNSNDPHHGYNSSCGGESGQGVPCSDEKKLKIRNSRLGELHWFYGTHLSEDHRNKISTSLKGKSKTTTTNYKEAAIRLRGKPVRCVETNLVYRSASEASEKTSICRSGISQVLIGKRNTAGGYHWEYVDNTQQLVI